MMKRVLWASGIIVIGVLVFIAFGNFQNFGKRARTAEVNLIAKELHEILHLQKVSKGSYPPAAEIRLKIEQERYKWGIGDQVKGFCNDCVITPDSYKIAIYGNIDDDEELDVYFLYSPDGELVPVKSDLAK